MYDTLKEVMEEYEPTAAFQKLLCETWYNQTNDIPKLKALRDYVETNNYGHGERPFYYMFKTLIKELPDEFTFLEIGGHKFQTVCLMRMLADMAGKKINRFCISPMNGAELNIESDFYADAYNLHQLFEVDHDYMVIEGYSENDDVMEKLLKQLFRIGKGDARVIDMAYIDGCHSYEVVRQDILNYIPLVRVGGFVVVDDCCNGWDLPQGYFGGIQSVSDAVDSLLPPTVERDDLEFLMSCCHVRVYRKIK